LVSTDLDSSQGMNLSILVDYILSNQDSIFFMNAEDLIGTEILDRTLLTTLSCFWKLIQMLSPSMTILFWLLWVDCYNSKPLELDYKITLYWVTQENSIKSSLQNSLSYILLQMVYTSYCASCPKWPCVKHEVNMWWPCCIMLLCSRTFYSFLSSPMINVVTIPSDVTGVTVWPITSNPNPRVLKIEKLKINKNKNKMRKKMKKKLSLYSLI